MAGRKRRSSCGLILIDCCLQIVYQGSVLTCPAPQEGLIPGLKPKSFLKFLLFIRCHPWKLQAMMMALSWWLSGSGVRNKQTSVFVHLGRLPTFRERALHWSRTWWNRVFCPSYQVFSLPPPHSPQWVLRPFSCSCFSPRPIEWIPLLFHLACIVKPLLTEQPFFVCPSPTGVPDTLSRLIKIH